MNEKRFGKHRGVVVGNADPLQQGRVQVNVPAVHGQRSGDPPWAMPCAPYGGRGVGFFAVPPVGANVWVEFEGGDITQPIWSGCFWNQGEVPVQPATAHKKAFVTEAISLVLDDTPGSGGFTLKVKPPAVSEELTLVFDAQGVKISTSRASIQLDNKAILLEQKPAKLEVSSAKINLENGGSVIEMTPAKVSINKDALEVI